MSKLQLKYPTEKRLQKRINAYYRLAKKKNEPLICARLAQYLNITSATLSTYVKSDDAYFAPIKKAYQVILADKETRLNSNKGNVTGIIFDLKNNHGWKDAPLIDNSKTINVDRRQFVYLDPKAIEENKSGTNRINAELSAE